MAVSKRLRFEIFRRDNHTCRYCGGAAPDVKLTIDHVTPTALGGTDSADNLVTACASCNSGKTSSSPDAHHVAAVSDDALRWADAMKQAVDQLAAQEQVKLDYRNAFLTEWHRWGIGEGDDREHIELPGDWKPSIENFRLVGLPAWVWGDIVDAAMGRDHVKTENKFKYCCGIAWNKVTELQEHAKTITGTDTAEPTLIDSVVQAALDVWAEEQGRPVDPEEQERFRESAVAAQDSEDPHRIVQAGQYAAWVGEQDVSKALTKIDREEIIQKWTFAWLAESGEWPNDERTAMVEKQVDALLAERVNVGRLVQAATHAGAHHSARLYFGLSEGELAVTERSEFVAKAAESWAVSYRRSTGHWPTQDKAAELFASLRQIGADKEGFYLDDVYTAAAAAGTYQDPNLATCLARHLSVFEAAAKPLAALPPQRE